MAKKDNAFRFRNWMVGALRGASRRFPPFYKKRNAAKQEYFIKTKMGKPLRRVKYQCEKCKEWFSSKEIRLDHTDPVVPLTGFPVLDNGEDDWNTYIKRMFCEAEGLSLLCVGCHNIKTNEEKAQRKDLKKPKE